MIQYILEYLNAFADLGMEMAPYLLLGFLFAGILFVWFPRKKVYKYLGKPNSASVINAALIGIPLPLCSCGVIPTGISFYNSGASRGSSVSFLVSTPQTGVDSLMVTYSLLGLPMAIVKPIIALFTGFFGGFLTNRFDNKAEKSAGRSAPAGNRQNATDDSNADRSFRGMLRYAFVEFLEDIAKWLVIGLALAALIEVVVPESFFTAYLGNEYLEMLLILVAAVPLYVCATGSVPIAAILMLKGLSPGAAIVFLMAGPATNAATMTVIGNVFGRRTLILYLISIIAGAYFFGVLVNEFLPREWFIAPLSQFHTGPHEHGLLPLWLKVASGILLGGLILNALYRRYISPRLRSRGSTKTVDREQSSQAERTTEPEYSLKPEKSYNSEQFGGSLKITEKLMVMDTTKIIVKGMTCNHCKASVENSLRTIEGVEDVEADLSTDRVSIIGDDIDLEQVREKVESLGYSYRGVSD
jgi:uncharacterized membrane protein YraQ (UPF0718 family)/copper chaperone CopZ